MTMPALQSGKTTWLADQNGQWFAQDPLNQFNANSVPNMQYGIQSGNNLWTPGSDGTWTAQNQFKGLTIGSSGGQQASQQPMQRTVLDSGSSASRTPTSINLNYPQNGTMQQATVPAIANDVWGPTPSGVDGSARLGTVAEGRFPSGRQLAPTPSTTGGMTPSSTPPTQAGNPSGIYFPPVPQNAGGTTGGVNPYVPPTATPPQPYTPPSTPASGGYTPPVYTPPPEFAMPQDYYKQMTASMNNPLSQTTQQLAALNNQTTQVPTNSADPYAGFSWLGNTMVPTSQLGSYQTQRPTPTGNGTGSGTGIGYGAPGTGPNDPSYLPPTNQAGNPSGIYFPPVPQNAGGATAQTGGATANVVPFNSLPNTTTGTQAGGTPQQAGNPPGIYYPPVPPQIGGETQTRTPTDPFGTYRPYLPPPTQSGNPPGIYYPPVPSNLGGSTGGPTSNSGGNTGSALGGFNINDIISQLGGTGGTQQPSSIENAIAGLLNGSGDVPTNPMINFLGNTGSTGTTGGTTTNTGTTGGLSATPPAPPQQVSFNLQPPVAPAPPPTVTYQLPQVDLSGFFQNMPGGQPPQQLRGPVISQQMQDQQLNAALSNNAATRGGYLSGMFEDLAGRGFSTGSPAAEDMSNRANMAQMLADTQARVQIPQQAAQINANYDLQAAAQNAQSRGQSIDAFNAANAALLAQQGLANQQYGLGLDATRTYNDANNSYYSLLTNANRMGLDSYSAYQNALNNYNQLGLQNRALDSSNENTRYQQLLSLLNSTMGLV